MRDAYYFAVILTVIIFGTTGCGRKVEIQSAAQMAAATIPAPESGDETLPHHVASLSIRRDQRGHIMGLFDVTSYVEDKQLCEVKQKVLKLIDRRTEGAVIRDLIFEMPSTAHLYMPLDDTLRKLYEDERNEFERFFMKGKKYRLTVYDCFAPCQNHQDVINIEPL
jgi:hypothetical protein